MNDRERFQALMHGRPVDRLPCYYFGQWVETLARWRAEGLGDRRVDEATGMDADWEGDLWGAEGLALLHPIYPGGHEVLEETATYRVERWVSGAVMKIGKLGSSIPETLEHFLKPTRASWEELKRHWDPADPARRPVGWEAKADALAGRTRVACFLAGSLYGWPREWMGVEAFSCLAFDDPALFEEIIAWTADVFMALWAPILERARFDFAYFFEDCCFNTGPLLSPSLYRRFFDPHYRRMLDFYRRHGVPLVLIDSDGKVDDLVPCWLESGFDILFPIEVGTWQADPRAFRRQYGRRLRMMGGVDKHVIPRGEAALRAHLEPLRGLAAEGGYLPLPDHRIPPHCSFEQFRTYVQVYQDVFRDAHP